MDVRTKKLNYYQTELVIDGKRLVLSDLNKKAEVKRKVGDCIINTILCIAFVAVMFWGVWIFFTHDEGHWSPDYVDENGVLYDTDGDGDYYYWVDPEH